MISETLASLRPQLGKSRLIAVSKTHSLDRLREAYDAGQRDFGESYAQELRDKAPQLPTDIRWHFVGALQRNKLKYIAPHAYRVHGITKVEQAEALARRAPGITGLINVNLGQEASKAGVSRHETLELAHRLQALPGFELAGLMCIPPFTEDPSGAEPFFEALAGLAATGRDQGLHLTELSMGMSRDWPHAVNQGATWIRIGTAIFGARVRR